MIRKGECKVHPRTGHRHPEGEWRYNSALSLTSALMGVGGQRHCLGGDPVPVVREAGLALQSVRKCAENLAPPGLSTAFVNYYSVT
jgi:hypothetical protein